MLFIEATIVATIKDSLAIVGGVVLKKPDQNNNTDLRIYYSATILALLIWSTSFISTKIAYTTFPPITLGAARFVIASGVLGIILFLKKDSTKPTLKDLAIISSSGILGITLYFTMENIGVSLTTASNAALIVASYPAITALLELMIYRIKISGFKILGIFLAMFGVYLVSYTNNSYNGQEQFVGNIILIATGVVWALYNFITRRIVNKYPAITISFYQTVAGTVCFIPLAFIERANWQFPTASSFTMLLYLGVLCSVVAFLLYNFGLRMLAPSTSVSLMNLVPIFGVIFSVLFLHETVCIRQLIGGVIIIAGVLLSISTVKNQQIDLKNNLEQKA